MSKYEFLDGLKKALASTNNQRLINENYEFYRNYIEEELKKQRSEEEIMEELGDPRLIANSIKEAAGIDDEFAHEEEPKTFYTTYSEDNRQGEDTNYDKVRGFSVSGTKARLILFGISAMLIIILILLIWLIGSLIYIFAPVILTVLVVLWLVHLFSRR